MGGSFSLPLKMLSLNLKAFYWRVYDVVINITNEQVQKLYTDNHNKWVIKLHLLQFSYYSSEMTA